MRNSCLILERSRRNEYRTNISFTLFGLWFRDIDAKIDTGCSYTTVPVQMTGLSLEEAMALKIVDSRNDSVKKHISFGVNDSKEKKETDKQLFRQGRFMDLKSVTFEHEAGDLEVEGLMIGWQDIRISYDRVGNILIGMDILEKLDIHMGESRLNGKQLFIACPKDYITDDYLKALNEHFGLTRI